MRLLLFLVLSIQTFACQVPVFRYALERWQSDQFRLQLITQGAPPADLEKNLLDLQTELTSPNSSLNLTLEVLDLNKLKPNQQLAVVGLEKIQSYPTFLLHPPESWNNPSPFVFPGDQSTLQSILDSPLRHRIKNNLLQGESIVWVLIEGSDQAANEAIHQLLQQSLKRAQEEIELPDGVIQADQIGKVGDDVDLENVLRSSVPLKISFKIERLKQNDPAEQALLKILTANRPIPPGEPLVVPIFGRGRTPAPLPGSRITSERILDACKYLCGACSCQVKSGNPGYDLLIKANWQEKLQSGLVVIEKELPSVLPSLNDQSQETQSSPLHDTGNIGSSNKFLIALAILAILALGIGSFVLLKRSAKN